MVKKWTENINKKAKTKGLVSKTKIIEEGTSIVGSIVEFAEEEGVDSIVVGTEAKQVLVGCYSGVWRKEYWLMLIVLY